MFAEAARAVSLAIQIVFKWILPAVVQGTVLVVAVMGRYPRDPLLWIMLGFIGISALGWASNIAQSGPALGGLTFGLIVFLPIVAHLVDQMHMNDRPDQSDQAKRPDQHADAYGLGFFFQEGEEAPTTSPPLLADSQVEEPAETPVVDLFDQLHLTPDPPVSDKPGATPHHRPRPSEAKRPGRRLPPNKPVRRLRY